MVLCRWDPRQRENAPVHGDLREADGGRLAGTVYAVAVGHSIHQGKGNDAELYADAVGRLKTIRVLYIDDFLKGNVTEADRNIAFEILNARYIKPECATIISSERTIGQILDWDEAIGSRIAERAKGFTMSVTGSGKNWRLR